MTQREEHGKLIATYLKSLPKGKAVSAGHIGKALGLSSTTAHNVLWQMSEDGLVVRYIREADMHKINDDRSTDGQRCAQVYQATGKIQ